MLHTMSETTDSKSHIHTCLHLNIFCKKKKYVLNVGKLRLIGIFTKSVMFKFRNFLCNRKIEIFVSLIFRYFTINNSFSTFNHNALLEVQILSLML